MRRLAEGLRLAFSWLTVMPVSGPENVDRGAAGRAVALSPIVGCALGATSAAVLWLTLVAGLPPILGGLLAVAVTAMLTRGMHLDGLADTADGLGCYGPPERARELMKSGSTGPFGVAVIAVVLGIQAVSLGELAHDRMWWAVVLLPVIGRISAVSACRRGTSASSATGFGALVAGTQSPATVTLWVLAGSAISVFVLVDRPWQGPLVVLVALGSTAFLVRHCVRRFGGLPGDVLGAAIEVTTAMTAVGLLVTGHR